MEKRYRFLDYYAMAASAGVALALLSFLLSEPKPLYAVAGSAVAAAALVAVFERACGYARTLIVNDDRIAEVCLGRISKVVRRDHVSRVVVEGSFFYSRLYFQGAGYVEVPAYVAEKLARDISAWWGIELEAARRPLHFPQQMELKH